MRLVTWNLGHRQNGHRCLERMTAALGTLEPDIALVFDYAPAAGRKSLRAALAHAGLDHQLEPSAASTRSPLLMAARRELVAGELDHPDGEDDRPPGAVHAHSPAYTLDILGLGLHDLHLSAAERHRRVDWAHRVSTVLRERRAVLVGALGGEQAGAANSHASPLRLFIQEGWQHALPPDGGTPGHQGTGEMQLDHALLSPTVQRIDTRYALEAAGYRLAGTRESLADQPVLVVDLQ